MFLCHSVESTAECGEVDLEEGGKGAVWEVNGFVVSVAEVLYCGGVARLVHRELILLHEEVACVWGTTCVVAVVVSHCELVV